ncbi:hypothetical protein [Falsihalocynthiibacter arcticus]|uniref:DUF5666 domain-containing protein n=1 Tax=Falsihalocynthiibacter arcticus TaxID=1579316 RepID=A0A126V1R9_9RHOB|nr:hypothetical protein [Falsihalocynthiibacter arcticus]AML52234.1 hypothetical protein RC74_14000 [Falsihalocynthiibacter arcticus]
MIRKSSSILCLVLAVLSASLFVRHASGENITAQNNGREQVTVSGSLVTRANGVDCPQIKTNDGTLIAISYISPEIPMGTHVVVSGVYAIVTDCLGRVVVAQETTVF